MTKPKEYSLKGKFGAWKLPIFTKKNTTSSQSHSTPKIVVAHHMVGNTYSYTAADWAEDIKLASAHGIDGFALNFGNDPWQPKQLEAAFAAALGSTFKLFLSFDMTSLPCSSVSDAVVLRNHILRFSSSPNQLRIEDKIVVSTFAGENCSFGRGTVKAGWRSVIRDGMPPICFIPAFFASSSSDGNDVVDGDFHWNGGWPLENCEVNFEGDKHRISSNKGKLYMAAVSPWFFTHYGPDSLDKNWIYPGDDWLYNRRWEMLVSNRGQIDIVQIISWNDYGESHYIGPIRNDQPNSQAWVNGFDHQGWLEMTEYYAKAFKTGSYPTIRQDKIYLWGRPHSASAIPTRPAASRPNNADLTHDFLWAVVFAVTAAQVIISSDSTARCFDVPAGVTKLKLESNPGVQSAKLLRNQESILELNPTEFNFTTNPESYNFNAFVSFSAAK